MDLNQAVYLIAVLVILLTLAHGRAAYWKGRNENTEIMHDNLVEAGESLKREVLFLRHALNKDASEFVEDRSY